MRKATAAVLLLLFSIALALGLSESHAQSWFFPGATTPAWTPNSITGVRVWGDCSFTANITTSTGAITNLVERTSNAYNFAQGTAANRPLLASNVQNSLSACSFDGSNDYLGATVGTDMTAATVCVLFRPAAIATFKALVTSSTQATGTLTFEEGPTSGASLDVWFTNVAARMGTGTGTIAINTWYRGCYTYDAAGPSGLSYINNVQLGTTNQANGFVESGPMTVGWDGGAGFSGFNGYIAEWVIVANVISSGDRGTLDSYWTTKWGL